MNILITGAAGNLGTFITHHLLKKEHRLNLIVHRKNLSDDIMRQAKVTVYRADLEKPETLLNPCRNVDCIVHFAGILFRPKPETFLPKTNVQYLKNMVSAALATSVKKFILISFPHVEGETTLDNRAQYRLDRQPESVHARTRLEAEKHLYSACQGTKMIPVTLRCGLIYGKGVLMIEAARWLLRRQLLAVWREPTWTDLLALPDFLHVVTAAAEKDGVSGIYNVADDNPMTVQDFLDTTAQHWGYSKPWRVPKWMIYFAACCCEIFALTFNTLSPLTRDFVKIGMASSVSDTARMKKELLPELQYPTLKEGLVLL